MPSLRSPFPVERASVRDPEAQVGQLHRLAVAGGPCRGLTRLLRRGEGLALGHFKWNLLWEFKRMVRMK